LHGSLGTTSDGALCGALARTRSTWSRSRRARRASCSPSASRSRAGTRCWATSAPATAASRRPDSGTNTLIVTHKPNITDAFGKDWFEIREGEASIFKPDGAGKAALVGRVVIDDWAKAKH
jgi:hypothetical protein